MDFETYVKYGLNSLPPARMNDRPTRDAIASPDVLHDLQYNPCVEATPVEGAIRGEFRRFNNWEESKIYPGTTRAISIYKSPNFDERSEAPLFAFFNDGDGYLWRQGDVRATYVFDNLVAKGELRRLVAVFVNPGISQEHPDQRSIEYDTVSARFSDFIHQEIEPLVEATIETTVSKNPQERLICGISSGGICAFNVAWHSPESFGLVLSHCGSFTNIRGGHNYPSMVRRNPRKPIRVFLQSGRQDLNIIPGNWAIANQDMASALEYAGYDHRFVFGEGGHSLRHGGAIFAESLHWLFRDDCSS